MAEKRGREAEYIAQLQALDLYEPAFGPAIHDLCVTEREYGRAMKAWREAAKAAGATAQPTDELYAAVTKLRASIQAQRESLGLTPRGLQKLRGRKAGEGGVAGEAMSRKLDQIWAKLQTYDETPASEASV